MPSVQHLVRHRIDGLENAHNRVTSINNVRHRIDGLETPVNAEPRLSVCSPSHRWFRNYAL